MVDRHANVFCCTTCKAEYIVDPITQTYRGLSADMIRSLLPTRVLPASEFCQSDYPVTRLIYFSHSNCHRQVHGHDACR